MINGQGAGEPPLIGMEIHLFVAGMDDVGGVA